MVAACYLAMMDHLIRELVNKTCATPGLHGLLTRHVLQLVEMDSLSAQEHAQQLMELFPMILASVTTH